MPAPDPLLELFSRYNFAIWPVQPVAWLTAVALVGLVAWRPSRTTDRLVSGLLALTWLFIGVVFQGIWVRELDPALSVVYTVVFVAQAALFVIVGFTGDRLSYRIERTPAGVLGIALIAYALVVYPLLGIALGHPYPEAPLFGAAPCPTTIFTFGLFLLARPPFPWVLLAVPFCWAVVATPAAVGRGVFEDVGLLLAGLIALWVITMRDRGLRRATTRPRTA
jgi:hypothetical protein